MNDKIINEMYHKQLLEKFINQSTNDELINAVLDLGKKVKQWQNEYNKLAEKYEILTDKKQLKVLIETPEQVALDSFKYYNVD